MRSSVFRSMPLAMLATVVLVAACTTPTGTAGSTRHIAGWQPLGQPDHGRRSLAGEEVTVIGSWGGAERAGQLPGDGQAVGGQHRQQVKYTGSRGLGAYLTTGRRVGHAARPRRPSGPGRDGCSSPQRARSSRSTTSSTWRPTRPTPCRRSSTSGRSTARSSASSSRALRQGLHLVQHDELRRHRAGELGRGHGDRSRPRQMPCSASASSRGADSGWPGTDWIEDFVIRQSGPEVYDSWVAGHDQVDGPRDQAGVRGLRRRPRATPSAARTTSTARTSATAATRCSTTRRAACSTTRRASSATSSRSRAEPPPGDFDFFVDARHQPGVRRRAHRRRRPVRDVLRQAGGQGPAEVPRHRRGPADLGRQGRRSCPPTPRSRRTRMPSSRSRPTPSGTPRSSASTAAT